MADERFALLSADTDKVKEYVFESAKLPEIRGASMLLDELNWGYDENERLLALELAERTIGDVFRDHGLRLACWPNGCLVYAGGGSLLAIVPLALAETIKQEIECLYPDQTGVATITCVWRPVAREELEQGLHGFGPGEFQQLQEQLTSGGHPKDWQRVAAYYATEDGINFEARHHFGELVRLNGMALKRAKEMKPQRPFYEALPHAVRCQSCQMRPASQQMDDGQFFCEPCFRKRRRLGEQPGRRRFIKSFWQRWFEEHLERHSELADRYYHGIPTDRWEDRTNRKGCFLAPQDLQTIGQACRRPRPGFVGFFYADGNDIGSLLNGEGRRPEDYIRISQQVSCAIKEAVYEALAEYLRPIRQPSDEGDFWIHPFEILTIGGDDVLLIVPGDVALPIAGRICRLFEEKANHPPLLALNTKPVTLSGGLVIADDHNPVYFLRNLSEELLKSAKRKAKVVKQGTVDFLVLKSQSMLETDLVALRESPLYTAGDQTLLLTGCPYTWDELQTKLWKSAVALRGRYPRTQVQALVAALQRGRWSSALFYLYQFARDKDEHQRLLTEIREKWDPSPQMGFWPWLKVEAVEQQWIGSDVAYRTPWPDIAEVLDFAGEPEGR